MDSPDEVFAAARSAAAAADWRTLFELMHTKDLLVVAANGARGMLPDEAAARRREMAARFGLRLDDPVRLAAEMTASAQRMLGGPSGQDAAALVDASKAHRRLVDEFEAALRASLERVADLPGLAAALEAHMRATVGGGSISSSLFGGEELTDVSVAGSKATANARRPDGSSRRQRFTRTRGGWRFHLGS